MSQKLGEAYVEISALTKELQYGLRMAETQVNSSMGRIHQIMQYHAKMSKQIWVTVGTAIAAAAVVGVTAAMDMQDSQAQLQDALGLTENKASEVQEVVSALWRDGLGQDLQDATMRVNAIGKAFGDFATRSASDIEVITKGVMTLADAFQESDEHIADTLSTMLRNFKDLKKEKALDIITKGMQKAGNKAGDFLKQMKDASPVLADLGYTGEEALSLILTAMQNGATDANDLTRAFTTFRTRILSDTPKAVEALRALGLPVQEIQEKIKAGGDEAKEAMQQVFQALSENKQGVDESKAAVDLFGTSFVNMGDKAFDAMAKADGKVKDLDGSFAKLDDRPDTMRESLDKLGRSAQHIFGELFAAALGEATDGMEPLLDDMEDLAEASTEFRKIWEEEGFAEAWNNFFSPETTATIAGLAAALTVLMIPAVWGLVRSLQAMAISLAEVAIAKALAFPELAVAAILVGLLTAAIVYLWLKWDEIWPVLKETWNSFWTWFGQLIDDIAAGVKQAWNTIVDWTQEKWTQLQTLTRTAWSLVQQLISDPVGTIKKLVKKAWDEILKWSLETWQKIEDKVPSNVKNMVKSALKWFASMRNDIRGYVNDIIRFLNGMIGGFNKVAGKIPGVNGPAIGKIPLLAKGGIVTGPTLAMVGEGRHSEAVLPLSDAVFEKLGEGIARNMGNNRTGGDVHVQVLLDGKQIYPTIRKQIHSDITGRLGGVR